MRNGKIHSADAFSQKYCLNILQACEFRNYGKN